ncbi:MAG TPA: helix-turn-helix domain-containing protein [Pyrinomonadaceae bacterium]|nr:helix-turn-helix domain-containing protein [Pyrinomonadaceae bacterium]
MSKNKKEAAAYLGISTRQLENYARQGRLSVRKEKGKTGDMAIFNDEELRLLKIELDAKRGLIQGAVVRDEANNDTGANGTSATSESHAIIRGSTSGLPQISPHEFIDQFAAAILARQAGQKQKHEPTINELAAKPLLTRAEAQRYTGLSRELLREAVTAGKIKEILLGRAYRMKRAELDRYVATL